MITTSDLIRVSVRQVLRQRSLGVIFSIALGIMAFITLSVLGREIRYSIGQDMILMGGVNIMQVYMDDGRHVGQPQREFYPDTVAALRALPGVDEVSINVHGVENFLVQRGESQFVLAVIGVDDKFAPLYAANVVYGRAISEDDVRRHRRVCVLGTEAARDIFGEEKAALGQLLFLQNDVFEVVGVMGGIMLGSWRRGGFLPYTTMVDRNWGGGKTNRLFVRAVAWEDVAMLKEKLPEVVHEHQSAPYLAIRTQDEQLVRIKNTFLFVEALLWLGIAASLLLGGFGIWYGTFSAVRARTREVGLKKAMGGSDVDILAQFLAEALCKAVAGGLLGIIAGTIVVEVGSFMLNCGVSYSQLLVSSISSIIFSALIGVVGGLFPALQASRMDVVSALRFE